MQPKRSFDRKIEDVANVLNMEHFNLTVPDQQLAALFYVTGLGFTRDPYIDFGTFNMWINVGEQQFHLPKKEAQKFRGTIGVVVPSLEDLKRRLGFIDRPMQGTQFEWQEENGHIAVTCPWGNTIKVHEANSELPMSLGILYGDMHVRPGVAEGIARFYQEVLRTTSRYIDDNEGNRAEVALGYNQTFIFRETEEAIEDYDGHHIAIYVVNFSEPHQALLERNLITEESDQHQYRFEKIIDPSTGETLTEIEHEVRSLHHPMRRRVLVNRNAAQTFGNYVHGRDVFVP